MSLKHAILGYLSWKPLSGYDLKKIFQDSAFMHWSGNNNQIYRTLLQLSEEKAIESEMEHRESAPSRKIYTITECGRNLLADWVKNNRPEVPEYKNEILVQLAWAGESKVEDLDGLLLEYGEAIQTQIVMHQEKKRRAAYFPDRNELEDYLWNKISDNMIATYEKELEWVNEIRTDLKSRFKE